MLGCCKGRGSGNSNKSLPSPVDPDFSVATRNVAPEHLLIKIESFSSLWMNGISKYESREFVAGDHKWKLTIQPTVPMLNFGPLSDNMVLSLQSSNDWVSVYLSLVETTSLPLDWEVNAMFTIFLFNHIRDSYVCFRGEMQRFNAMNPKRGFPKLIPIETFTDPSKGFLVRDNCVFGAEVYVIKSTRVIDHVSLLKSGPSYKHSLVVSQFSKLENVWTSEELTAGDHLWKVMLYPNGNASAKGRGVSLYIEYVDYESFGPHDKVMAKICMCIKSKIGKLSHTKNFSEWFSSTKSSKGFAEFMAIGDLQDPEKGYLVDDSCFLEIEISILALVRNAPT